MRRRRRLRDLIWFGLIWTGAQAANNKLREEEEGREAYLEFGRSGCGSDCGLALGQRGRRRRHRRPGRRRGCLPGVAAWVSEPNPTAAEKRKAEQQPTTPRDLSAAGPIGMGKNKELVQIHPHGFACTDPSPVRFAKI